MSTPDSHDITRILLPVTLLILILCAIIFLFNQDVLKSLVGQLKGSDADPHTVAAEQAAVSGDFDAARAQAERAIGTLAPNDPYYQGAEIVLETIAMWKGTKEGYLEAVRSAKDRYLRAQQSPVLQAVTINSLLSYAFNAGNADVTNEIFNGEPFQSYAVQDDPLGSLMNLATFSNTLLETSAAHFAKAKLLANELRQHITGKITLEADDVQKHVDDILFSITRADSLFDTELAASKTLAFGGMYEPEFFFTEGYLYGVLSFVDRQYLEQSEIAFKRVIEHYNSVESTLDGTAGSLYSARIPYTYLYLSTGTYMLQGEKRLTDVQTYLRELVRVVNKNPSIHERSFLPYIRAIGAEPSKYTNDWFNEKRLRMMASVSDEFKTLLKENGWRF